MHEQELKLKLVKELPKLLRAYFENKIEGNPNSNRTWYFVWLDGPVEQVTDREWDWVVRECERKLTAIQWLKYFPTLCSVVWGSPITMESSIRLVWESTWQQRAIAYFKVKGE